MIMIQNCSLFMITNMLFIRIINIYRAGSWNQGVATATASSDLLNKDGSG